MCQQCAIVCGFVERDADDFFAEHVEIVGYDQIELCIGPIWMFVSRHADKF